MVLIKALGQSYHVKLMLGDLTKSKEENYLQIDHVILNRQGYASIILTK